MSQHKKIILHEGGSRSSKTWSIFQFFILKALQGENIRVTIVRDKMTWLKNTLLKDFGDMCEMYDLPVSPRVNSNRQDQVYYINGTEFAFFGADEPQKLHGKRQDWFWINEAMEVGQAIFDQFEMRTRIGGIIDYNPSDDTHWVFKIQLRPDVGLIKSTVLDNPFLGDKERAKILSYDPNNPVNVENGTADLYMWEVYGQGNRARVKGAIYTKWDVVEEIPLNAKFMGYGLDFGFSSDPASLIELWVYDKEIYLHEVIYRPGLVNYDNEGDEGLVNQMKILNIPTNASIYADSSEPKSIQELNNHGFHGVVAVVKGPDSVNYGINILKGFRMHITRSSVNIERELRKYKWAEDKNGEPLSPAKAIDKFNHALDAARYVAMSTLAEDTKVQFYEALG